MNTLLLEHLAAVSKIAAYRQSRERQQGMNCSEGYLISTDAGLQFGGPRTFEIFFRYEFVDQSQYIGGFQSPTISVVVPYNERERDLIYMYCGATYVWLPITSGNYYHAVVSYNGSESVCYLNGVEVGRKPFEGDVASLQFRIGAQSQPPKGPIYLCRHYDYALSAEEVAALYNNGDPAGYVLPTLKKKFWEASDAQIAAIVWRPNNVGLGTMEGAYTDNANGFDGRYARMKPGTNGFSMYSSKLYSSNVPGLRLRVTFKYRSSKGIHMATTSSINVDLPANTGDAVLVEGLYSPPDTSVYGFNFNMNASSADDWVEIQPVYIGYVGCMAEYLPQNLTLVDIDKPDKTIVPDLMDDGKGHSDPYIGLYFNNDQQDATYSRINGKIVASIGSHSLATNRPMMTYYRYKFTPGRYYRITIKWSLISGSYFLEAFGSWATDAYVYTGDSLHTEHGSYEYVSPVLKAKEGLTNYVNPTFFFGTRVAQSEISIDEVIIEEYFSPSGTNGWLDSAKQLPLNNEYLPPLLETAGGYDLTADRTPGIVYKPE